VRFGVAAASNSEGCKKEYMDSYIGDKIVVPSPWLHGNTLRRRAARGALYIYAACYMYLAELPRSDSKKSA
jgi:hypothetical protein